MSPPSSRRDVMTAGLALVGAAAVGGLSGCLGSFGSSDEVDPGRIDDVPAGATFVVHADVNAILADEAFRDGFDDELAEQDSGFDNWTVAFDESVSTSGELLDVVGSEWGLNPRTVSEVLVFGPDDDEMAAILWTNWVETDLRTVLESEGDFQQDSYAGRTTYVAHDVSVTGLDDGVYAFGHNALVRALIDYWEDDGETVSGPAREAYLSSTDGYLRFGFEFPEDGIATLADQVNEALFEDVLQGSGSVYPAGDDRVATFQLEAASSSAADDLERAIDGFVTLLRQDVDETIFFGGTLGEVPPDAIHDVEVSRDDAIVTVEYRSTPADAAKVLASLFFSAPEL